MPKLQIVIALTALLLTGGCADRNIVTYGTGAEDIRISGSTTMELLLRAWAEEFTRAHPDISIVIETTSSGDGISSLIRGRSDMAAASRPLLPSEAREMLARRQSIGFAVRAAKDALSIYVHPSNPVKDLSLEQLRDVLSGRIANWSLVGGNDEPILLFARERGSGSAVFIEEHVLLGSGFSPDALLLESTDEVVEAVTSHPNGVGFGGIAFGTGLHHISINGIAPTTENVLKDLYPVSRYLFLFTVKPPQGLKRDFVNYVLSEHGQSIADSIGYVPLYGTR